MDALLLHRNFFLVPGRRRSTWQVSTAYRARAGQSHKRRRKGRIRLSAGDATVFALRDASHMRRNALAWCREECPTIDWIVEVFLGEKRAVIGACTAHKTWQIPVRNGRSPRAVRDAARELIALERYEV